MNKLTYAALLFLFTQISCAHPKERPMLVSATTNNSEKTITQPETQTWKCQGNHPSLKQLNLCVGYRWLKQVDDQWVPTNEVSTQDDESVLQVWFYSAETPLVIVKATFPIKVFTYMVMKTGSHPGPKGKPLLLQDGSYRIHGISFFMDEQWQIHIQALHSDKKTILDSTYFEHWVK